MNEKIELIGLLQKMKPKIYRMAIYTFYFIYENFKFLQPHSLSLETVI